MSRYLLIIITVFSFTILSCNKTISDSINHKSQHKLHGDPAQINNIYERINYYKWLAFEHCLVIGSYRSPLMYSILEKEEVNICEYPGSYVMNIMDSIANITREKIIKDSIYLANTWLMPDGEYGELSGGRRVISHCLELYSSPELDSLIKKRFKKK